MQRTIRLELTPSPTQADSLAQTSRLFTAAFNRFVELGWEEGVSNATKLHYLAYYTVRSVLPSLNSNLINTARAKAAEAIKSAFALQKRKRTVSMPSRMLAHHATTCIPTEWIGKVRPCGCR
jgi:putative transposase